MTVNDTLGLQIQEINFCRNKYEWLNLKHAIY